MALESEPQSTLIGGSNLDALKSESNNDVDLEDGEIDDDEEEAPVPVKAAEPSPSVSAAKPSFPAPAHAAKGPDPGRREWVQHRPIHHNQNVNKRGMKRSWEPPHKKPFHDEDEEDDFSVQLEKALREKAQKHQALKDGLNEDGEADGTDDGDHQRKKKKRKSRWDEDEERNPKHTRRNRDGDDDDMIFVRGASPHHRETGEPPSFGHDFKNKFNTYAEEDDEYDDIGDRSNHSGFQGRGRGHKMIRGRGRGRLGLQTEGLRGGFSKRGMMKRGNLRGGSLGKPPHMLRDRMQDNICAYFMQGKCAKGPDDCPYSHDAQPPRKMELCKFYLKNCCAKREKCLYMHKDFPCKFFHTGRRCDSGEHCRFSHDQLSESTRNVLLKHLEVAPKEILGEFKRITREEANLIIDKAAKLRAQGKNPEGINLLLCDDEGGYSSGEDRPHTPMPSSPGEPVPEESDFKRSRDDGGHSNRKRDSRDKHREHDRNRQRDRDRQHEHAADKREHRERKRKRRWDSPDSSPTRLEKLKQMLKDELLQHDMSDKDCLNSSADSVVVLDVLKGSSVDKRKAKDEENCTSSKRSEEKATCSSPPNKGTGLDIEKKIEDTTTSSNKLTEQENLEESGGESQDSCGAIPSHLPKRQRELFMRIQQQMREADQSNENKPCESSDDPPPEDDWYSSDEDGPTSLTDLIKNLPKNQKSDEKLDKAPQAENRGRSDQTCIELHPDSSPSTQSTDSNTEKQAQQSRRPPLLPTPINLNDLMKSSAIDQLLHSMRYGSQAKSDTASNSALESAQTQSQLESSNPDELQSPSQQSSSAPVPVRDPRLTRDPRSRGGAAVNIPSPLGSPSSACHAPEPRTGTGRADPRLDRRDPRMESRTGAVEPQASPSPHRGDARPVDPRAARMEARRTSEGSSSSTGSNSNICQGPLKSIYDNAGLTASGLGDIDLRMRGVGPDSIQGSEFLLPGSQFGSGDMDMRRPEYSVMSGAHPLPAHDTDLRFGLNNPLMDIDSDYPASSHSDLDLRRLELMLPFKPAPMHTAATEINASLSSYAPAPYHVTLVDIPRPDFSSLKISPQDPQAKLDPRLRRLFRLSQDEAPSALEGEQQPVTAAPGDPRRRSSTASRPADPRQGRMSGFCPPTPRADDFDDPNPTDSDQQSYFGQPGRSRGLLPTPDRSEQPPWTQPGRPRPPYHHQRSFTPPLS